MSGKHSKVAGLFILAMVLLNFPLLGIFTHASSVNGIPTILIYLFVVWLAIIWFIKQNVDSHPKDKKDKNKNEPQN
ncbi:MAG: hypothetical protein JNL70_23790 [Saprospiraceae bacterium]|nr:hypothetical protein [Saprospiraceae bacterium]